MTRDVRPEGDPELEAFGPNRRIITFHIHYEGDVENAVRVVGLNLPNDKPSVVIIQPAMPNRVSADNNDKFSTIVGEVTRTSIQFRYRRVDSGRDPAMWIRFDFLLIF